MFLSLYVLQLAIAENIPESNSLPLIGGSYYVFLKGLALAKIIKKSVILFWLINRII